MRALWKYKKILDRCRLVVQLLAKKTIVIYYMLGYSVIQSVNLLIRKSDALKKVWLNGLLLSVILQEWIQMVMLIKLCQEKLLLNILVIYFNRAWFMRKMIIII